MKNWISIKDELPQPFKTVRITNGCREVTAYRAFDEENLADVWYDENGKMYDGEYNFWHY